MANLTDATRAAGGSDHSLAIKKDGSLWVWGDNQFGQLGLPVNTIGNPAPPQQIPGLTGFRAVAAGTFYSLALNLDGTVFSWGRNDAGQLGRACSQAGCVDSAVPTRIPNLFGVVGIAAGGSHALAILNDGTVRAWGDNSSGQLGDNSTTRRTSPVAVANLNGVRTVAGGSSHSLAVKYDGTAWAWGSNASGQLGDNMAPTGHLIPARVGTLGGENQVAAGSSHSLASQSEPIGGAIGEAEQRGGNFPCSTHNTSSPVNTGTGDFWHTFSDLSIPGRGAPLDFVRTYNSTAASEPGASATPLGYGWTFSYGVSISTTATAAKITEEAGNQVDFDLISGVYVAHVPRNIATLVSDGATYTYTRRATEILKFDVATKRLKSKQTLDPNSTTTINYTSATQWVITDPGGRTLTIALAGGLIQSVTDNASPARSLHFYYEDGAGNLTRVTDVNNKDTKFSYDANHRMLTMLAPKFSSDPTKALVNEYDPSSGKLVTQTDPKGRATLFDYVPSGAPPGSTKITDPKGNKTLDTYAFGELVAETRGWETTDAQTWRYAYDPVTANCAAVVDPNGHIVTSTYDTAGNRTSITDALGRRRQFIFNGFNQPLSMTDPAGVVTTYGYDGAWGPNAGHLTTTTTPLLNLVTGAVEDTRQTTYRYGERAGNQPSDLTSVVAPESDNPGVAQPWTVDYDTFGYPRLATDPLGHKTTTVFDNVGRKRSETSPRGNVNNPPSPPDPAFTTTFDYTNDNLLTKITDPLSRFTLRDYDDNRNLKTFTDAENHTTQYAYTPANELDTVTRADAAATTRHYDYFGDGSLAAQTDGATHSTSYTYDSLARVKTVTTPPTAQAPAGNKTTYGYDPAGNAVSKGDSAATCTAWPFSYPVAPVPGCTFYRYDAADELTGTFYSDGSTPNVDPITYDADGRRQSMTDTAGTASWLWDSLGRLRLSTPASGATNRVSYTYDLRNQLRTISYPGAGDLSRHFDDAGHLDYVEDWTPAHNRTTFGYDPDDNLLSRGFPTGTGVTDALTYDNAGQLTDIAITKGTTTLGDFNYPVPRWKTGLVKSVSSTGVPADNNSYVYTPLNQLGSVNGASFSYDAADNLKSFPNGVTQNFDNANQLTSAPQATTSLNLGTTGDQAVPGAYEGTPTADVAAFRPSTGGWLLSNGTTVYWGASGDTPVRADYDGDRKTDIAVFRPSSGAWYVRNGATVFWGGSGDVAVPADYDGDRKADIAVFRPSTGAWYINNGTTAYWGASGDVPVPADYDGDGKADIAVFRPSTGTWYLANGATVSWGASGDVPVPADYDGDGKADIAVFRPSTGQWFLKLSSSSGGTYAFDSRGNRISVTPVIGPKRTYAYDQANRLKTAPGASYAYRGDGLRTSKTVGPTITTFGWDESGGLPQLLSETTTAGTARYIYGPGGLPVERIGATGDIAYYHQDQLGSTRQLTDSTGAVTGTATYDPYGHLRSATGNFTSQPLGFAGQYTDAETGFQYLRARYYDPATANFMTRDPIATSTQQPYSYANGNPVNSADPSGLIATLADIVTTENALNFAEDFSVNYALNLGFQTGMGLLSGCGVHLNQTQAIIAGGLGAFTRLASAFGGSAAAETGEDLAVEVGDGISAPGPYAEDSIPANGADRNFSPEQRKEINRIGNDTGCHACGSTDPGTKSGNFVPDHQPPNVLNSNGDPQRLYPHCISCSRIQGGTLSGAGR